MGFAAAIKAGRDAKGLKQDELAREIGVSQVAVSKWESGKAKPSMALMPKLARLLGLDLADLVCLAAGVDDEPVEATA